MGFWSDACTVETASSGRVLIRDHHPGYISFEKHFESQERIRDNEVMEGLMPNDLRQLGTDGFLVTPPDTRSNTQRIFVPRSALTEMLVLAVIGGQQARRRAATGADARQPGLFGETSS